MEKDIQKNQTKTDLPIFHTMSTEAVYMEMGTTITGLSVEEASRRLNSFGHNQLAEVKQKTLITMFVAQFKNAMVIILLCASIIAAFMGEVTDTVIILAVVVINAVLGVVQESKAEKALAALKKMSSPYSRIIREGNVMPVKSSEIVPGDIVLLEAGDYVPADIRLTETAILKLDESALTGESEPIEKFTDAIDDRDIVTGDKRNMAFAGSSVVYGRGKGIAVETAMRTEIGKIAGLIQNLANELTPLQKKLEEVGKFLSIGIVVIALIILGAGLLQGREPLDMFLTAISLAVAAIPEGLPAIVTIVMALGVQKMARQNAIIRKLPAVETLGSTSVICSDKTGTLTQNKMTVREIFTFDSPNKSGITCLAEEYTPQTHSQSFELLIQIAALCNDSKLSQLDNKYLGDPTETALASFAAIKGRRPEELDKIMPRQAELPFDSVRKMMSTIVAKENSSGYMILAKGAPDIMTGHYTHILDEYGKIVPITVPHIEKIREANSHMASKALRVLSFAFKNIENLPSRQEMVPEKIEQGLVFAGLTGMMDPPRPEVAAAVIKCKQAGIRPVMITGDHKDTAFAIARELGIADTEDTVITGSELDKISEEDFSLRVTDFSVYARVSPEHKMRIVKAWRDLGKVVAMTGDGVNDAPALKMADIGIGMGISGTEVAKGVSDMVLADDNFATIILAVEEGRRIFSNIRKGIQFLLSANMGEVLVLFIATLLKWTILLPIHILWINLVTDVLPALALGFEKSGTDVMRQTPRDSSKGFFAGRLGVNIVYQGLLEGLITLGIYYIARKVSAGNQAVSMTIAFMTLGLIQLVHTYNVRAEANSVFSRKLPFNPYLLGAIAISVLLQVIVVFVPLLNGIFKVVPLSIKQWALVLAGTIMIIPMVEIEKLLTKLFYKAGR